MARCALDTELGMTIISEIVASGIVCGGAGIAGTVCGLAASRWLRTCGDVRVFISDWRIFYRGRDASGTPVDVPPAQAEFAQFFFTADFYNSREEPTGLRELCVDFCAADQALSVTPGDADSLKVEPTREVITDVEIVNLVPKQWLRWHFRRNVWGQDVAKVIAATQVFLSATDPKGRRQRYPVTTLPGRLHPF